MSILLLVLSIINTLQSSHPISALCLLSELFYILPFAVKLAETLNIMEKQLNDNNAVNFTNHV
jgi:hypothetical protein